MCAPDGVGVPDGVDVVTGESDDVGGGSVTSATAARGPPAGEELSCSRPESHAFEHYGA